jgi:hypothetical protein
MQMQRLNSWMKTMNKRMFLVPRRLLLKDGISGMFRFLNGPNLRSAPRDRITLMLLPRVC